MTDLEIAMESTFAVADEQVYLFTRTDAELLALSEKLFKDHLFVVEITLRWQEALDRNARILARHANETLY